MKVAFHDNNILIRHLKNGDENAYSFLVDSYHHNLCVYVNSLVNNPSMAEDIVQNVFIKTWEKRSSLKPDFSIKSFLYRLVYNEFIDQYRKNRAVMALEKNYLEALNDLIDEKNKESTDKLIQRVKMTIKDLPPKCKNTFLLSKEDGLTNVEISEYLEVSIKTVEAQITKAFTIIREKLGKSKTVLLLVFG